MSDDPSACMQLYIKRLVTPYVVIELSRYSLLWRHNEHDSVSNHQPRGCLLDRLFRRRSKKTSKLRVTGLCAGNSPGPVNSPHKGPVTRKMFPFDDVIMLFLLRFVGDGTNHYLKQHWLDINNALWHLPVNAQDINQMCLKITRLHLHGANA